MDENTITVTFSNGSVEPYSLNEIRCNPNGIVIKRAEDMEVFYPWHRIDDLTAHPSVGL